MLAVGWLRVAACCCVNMTLSADHFAGGRLVHLAACRPATYGAATEALHLQKGTDLHAVTVSLP